MGLTLIVGGQFGSEGKGKICSYLAGEVDLAIRTGGPNSGHTVVRDSAIYALRQVPATFLNKKCQLALAAGAIIDLEVFLSEIRELDVEQRVVVDHNAMVITPDHKTLEDGLKCRIGSTGTGTGAATAAKLMRNAGTVLARDVEELRPFLCNVSNMANEYLDKKLNVLVEGTQGIGLSLHHGYYPYVTSRDTTPGTMCGDVGLSPRLVSEIILVIRTYPIRVAGNSGPLNDEIDWKTVTLESGAPFTIVERTTVTRKTRRVARFDLNLVRKSVKIARPTQIALNFLDYLDYRNFGKISSDALTYEALRFVSRLEYELDVPVCLFGTGPEVHQVVDLRGAERLDKSTHSTLSDLHAATGTVS